MDFVQLQVQWIPRGTQGTNFNVVQISGFQKNVP